MKRYLPLIITIALGIGAGLLGRFYYANLQGAGPALRAPLPPVPSANQDSQNATGLPLLLPEHFSISTFASGLPGPRVLLFDQSSRLLASLTSAGQVVALPDENTDQKADRIIPLLTGLRKPHGLAFACEGNAAVQECTLFVAEEHRVTAYTYDQSVPSATNPRKILDLPTEGGGHFTRTLLIHDTPEGRKLLISIGSSCNVCNEDDPRRASIYSSNLDGSDFKPFATGLRNAVFMTTHPVTGEIWATEMGRDLLGDNTPPDEINILHEGQNYGWPICYGKNVHDTNFDKNVYIQNPCTDKQGSHIDIPAHSAPLGLAFAPEEGWPEDYWHNVFVSYHGSWNRSTPTGYKIVRFKLNSQGVLEGSEDFVTGFLPEGSSQSYGRPVDILTLPGGSMYVSDDKAGSIYLIQRTNS